MELREEIAQRLGLEKGGITEHDSPANEHYYFVQELMNYDTEEVESISKINFESEIDNIINLVEEEKRKAVAEFAESLGLRHKYESTKE